MMPLSLKYFLLVWSAIFVILMPVQLYVSVPYGRHTRDRWGLLISNKLGWILMEGWAIPVFVIVYATHFNSHIYNLLFATLYLAHYVHRAFIYPLRIHTKGKKMPISIVLSAIFFNSVNAGLNAWVLSRYAIYPEEYWKQIPFIIGIILFAIGAYINISSDNILIGLRKPGDTGYKIPSGGLFAWVSCANMFGEIVEWAGYAMMCWHLAALSFLFNTAANLIPRAIHHHGWYHEHFPNYPKERKAIIPFIL